MRELWISHWISVRIPNCCTIWKPVELPLGNARTEIDEVELVCGVVAVQVAIRAVPHRQDFYRRASEGAPLDEFDAELAKWLVGLDTIVSRMRQFLEQGGLFGPARQGDLEDYLFLLGHWVRDVWNCAWAEQGEMTLVPYVIFSLGFNHEDADVCVELCKHFLQHLEEGVQKAQVDELDESNIEGQAPLQ